MSEDSWHDYFYQRSLDEVTTLAARVAELEAGLGELANVADSAGDYANIGMMDDAIAHARALLAPREGKDG